MMMMVVFMVMMVVMVTMVVMVMINGCHGDSVCHDCSDDCYGDGCHGDDNGCHGDDDSGVLPQLRGSPM